MCSFVLSKPLGQDTLCRAGPRRFGVGTKGPGLSRQGVLQELRRHRWPGELCWRLGGMQTNRATEMSMLWASSAPQPRCSTLTQLQELQYRQLKNLIKEKLRRTVKRSWYRN